MKHYFSAIEIVQLHFAMKMYLSELFRRTASNPLHYQALKKSLYLLSQNMCKFKSAFFRLDLLCAAYV